MSHDDPANPISPTPQADTADQAPADATTSCEPAAEPSDITAGPPDLVPDSDDLPPPPDDEPPEPDSAAGEMVSIDAATTQADIFDPFGTTSLEVPSSAHDANKNAALKRGLAGIRRCDGVIPALRMLAELAVAEVLPPRVIRAMRRGDPIVVLVCVPSANWVSPVGEVFDTASSYQARRVTKTSRPRPTTSADPDGDAGARIGEGQALVAISPEHEWLAPVLVAAADHEITVPPLSPELVTRAIRLWTGRPLRRPVRPEDVAGLDILDVAGALRAGASPGSCLIRLRRASSSRIGLPETERVTPLADLCGYGAAHVWALDLVAAIAKVRAGIMSPDLLEGCVFYGKPGLGKTVLAKSIAQAAGLPFVQTSIGDWFSQSSGHLDGVIKMCDRFVDSLMIAAKSNKTAIGFVDELDALPNRARLSDRGADWWLPVITHVLIRFEALRKSGVVLLAATNHLDRIDGALLRPGRFDRAILIEHPDEAGRLGILRTHLGNDLADVDLIPAARLAAGMSGAMLAGHVRAARRRAEDAGRFMSLDDLLWQIAPADERSASERWAVAVHEAGHACAAQVLGLALTEVSIQAGADHGGITTIRLDDPMPNRLALERHVVGMLSGRAADTLLGTGAHAGAAGDLREATRVVTAIHASLGLADHLSVRIGPDAAVSLLREDPALADTVEADLRRLAREADRLVRTHRGSILAVAEELLARRVLSGAEVAVLAARPPPKIPARSGRRSSPVGRTASVARPPGPGEDASA